MTHQHNVEQPRIHQREDSSPGQRRCHRWRKRKWNSAQILTMAPLPHLGRGPQAQYRPWPSRPHVLRLLYRDSCHTACGRARKSLFSSAYGCGRDMHRHRLCSCLCHAAPKHLTQVSAPPRHTLGIYEIKLTIATGTKIWTHVKISARTPARASTPSTRSARTRPASAACRS